MRNFIERLGVRIVATGLQGACMILIARQVGPATFGLLALGIATSIIAGAITSMGSTTRALRILREDEPYEMAASLAAIRLSSMLIGMLIVVIVLVSSGSTFRIAVAVTVISAVDQYCDFEQAIRAGFLEHRSSTLLIVMQRGLPAVTVTLGYLLGQNTIDLYAVASIIVLVAALRGPWSRWRGRIDVLSAMRGSAGYWVNTIAVSLQQLDVAIVRLATGSVGVGLYGAANKLDQPLGLLVNSAVVALSPSMGQIADQEQRHRAFVRFGRIAGCGGLALIVASPVVATIIVKILGYEYKHAFPIIIGVTIATGVGCVAQVLQAYLTMEGRAREVATAAMGGVIAGLSVLFVAGRIGGTPYLGLGLFANYSVASLILFSRVRSIGTGLKSSPGARLG